MMYLVEFTLQDDLSTYAFQAHSLVNVIRGLQDYADDIGWDREATSEDVTSVTLSLI